MIERKSATVADETRDRSFQSIDGRLKSPMTHIWWYSFDAESRVFDSNAYKREQSKFGGC